MAWDLESYRHGSLILGKTPRPSAEARAPVLLEPWGSSLLFQYCAFPLTLLRKHKTWQKGTERCKK